MMLPLILIFGGILASVAEADSQKPLNPPITHITGSDFPQPPEPEPITVTRLPLPPISPNDQEGSCSRQINPRGTGCIGKVADLHSGNFLPDNNHIVAIANFTGAPATPDPASIYRGQNLILIKSNGATFSNGDSWKCITCGVSEYNSRGRNAAMNYPQAFRDGKRVLVGANIVECDEGLASDSCTPETTRIYPLRWNTRLDNAGPGAPMRELRIHPDNVHLGFSQFHVTEDGGFDQFCYFGRLKWNPNPEVGEPLAPRYDVVNVSIFFNDNQNVKVEEEPQNLPRIFLPTDIPTVGELRGFSGSGQEVTYIGYPSESSNIDVYAADLQTGKVRRLTAHPEYCDPVDISPDDKWHVVLDTRGTERQMFLSGLRGIPPVTDLVTTAAVASVRNNGHRRFFQPWIIDQYGDREEYFGQKLNTEGSGIAGSSDINDPEWNGRADAKWSWDGTKIVYTQIQTLSPACGGNNPLPCYPSNEEGGRSERIMVAHLTRREPFDFPEVNIVPDEIPWGTPFPPGSSYPRRGSPPAGDYLLEGKVSGYAKITLAQKQHGSSLETVSAVYHEFSDDGTHVISGNERVSVTNPTLTLQEVDWHSNITQTGLHNGTKLTGKDGFQLRIDVMTNFFQANGSIVTIVDGKEYRQPENGT